MVVVVVVVGVLVWMSNCEFAEGGREGCFGWVRVEV